MQDPARTVASDPRLFAVSMAAAGLTAVVFARRAARARGVRRLAWLLLVASQLGQLAGMLRERRKVAAD